MLLKVLVYITFWGMETPWESCTSAAIDQIYNLFIYANQRYGYVKYILLFVACNIFYI